MLLSAQTLWYQLLCRKLHSHFFHFIKVKEPPSCNLYHAVIEPCLRKEKDLYFIFYIFGEVYISLSEQEIFVKCLEKKSQKGHIKMLPLSAKFLIAGRRRGTYISLITVVALLISKQ
jgi:hypothetical protein